MGHFKAECTTPRKTTHGGANCGFVTVRRVTNNCVVVVRRQPGDKVESEIRRRGHPAIGEWQEVVGKNRMGKEWTGGEVKKSDGCPSGKLAKYFSNGL
jgi:hypothetical protein